MFVRRDTLEKFYVPISEVKTAAKNILKDIQSNLLASAQQRLVNNIVNVNNFNDFKTAIENGKWVLAAFDGDATDEVKIKELTGASTRCIPFILPITPKNNVCFYTGKKTNRYVLFAKAY